MPLAYRMRQFWHSLTASPTPNELAAARSTLSDPLMNLFERMQPSEQFHSLNIHRQLSEQGHTHPDLLAAALLHDIGKSRYPLQVWDRALIVLARAAVPAQARSWGQGDVNSWRRPFVVAEQHPTWGADMAAQAAASPLTVSIIRRHQEKYLAKNAAHPANQEDELLLVLQQVDADN